MAIRFFCDQCNADLTHELFMFFHDVPEEIRQEMAALVEKLNANYPNTEDEQVLHDYETFGLWGAKFLFDDTEAMKDRGTILYRVYHAKMLCRNCMDGLIKKSRLSTFKVIKGGKD